MCHLRVRKSSSVSQTAVLIIIHVDGFNIIVSSHKIRIIIYTTHHQSKTPLSELAEEAMIAELKTKLGEINAHVTKQRTQASTDSKYISDIIRERDVVTKSVCSLLEQKML